jgi:anthranilate phosphoribosyltransferase
MLVRLASGSILTETQAEAVFEAIMTGEATPAQIGAALMALAMRGETIDELTAAVHILRRHSIRIPGGEDAIDCCGTGGDGRNTLNISTAVAFVVAACGVRVAKHGNRGATSRSGTADVLTALGIDGSASPETAAHMLARHGLTFLFAPNHHPAMRAVAPLRRDLGFRTVFNLAGPLANPAETRRQLVGVYDARWVEPVAHVLRRLGSISAWVVHGSDGLDELTITGPSKVAILADGEVRRRTVTPEDAGLPRADLSEILGGDPPENAAKLIKLLDGEIGAYRNVVLLNAAAALIVAGKAVDLPAGVAIAAAAIDRGDARRLFDAMTADHAGKAV